MSASYRLIRVGQAHQMTRGALVGLLVEEFSVARYDPI